MHGQYLLRTNSFDIFQSPVLFQVLRSEDFLEFFSGEISQVYENLKLVTESEKPSEV